jgi:hypothetical protein
MMPLEWIELNHYQRSFLESRRRIRLEWDGAADRFAVVVRSLEMMKRGLIAVALLVAAVYLGDYGWLAYRARGNGGAFGSVTLDTYYTVKLKSGKTEFDYAGPETLECVRSLLPHMGDKPCWYASRKKEQQIDIDSGDANNPHVF